MKPDYEGLNRIINKRHSSRSVAKDAFWIIAKILFFAIIALILIQSIPK